jgi:hypothetical protein
MELVRALVLESVRALAMEMVRALVLDRSLVVLMGLVRGLMAQDLGLGMGKSQSVT